MIYLSISVGSLHVKSSAGFFNGHLIKNEKNTIYAQANYNFKIFYFK